MTDQELFEKLKRDGECWLIGEVIRSRCFGKDPDTGESNSCTTTHDPADQNPNFATPDGFFWLWERAQEREIILGEMVEDRGNYFLPKELIHRTRLRDALKEYLKGDQHGTS